jgi:hypothetical protein
MRQQQFMVLGELIIPLMGYYLWNWDLHFILLFYYLDVVASFFLSIAKVRAVSLYRERKWMVQTHLTTFLTWYGLILLGLSFLEIAILAVYPDINLVDSLFEFLTYEEWGIPQGVVLLPLIFLLNWQHYKLVFLRTGEYAIFPTDLLKRIQTSTFGAFTLGGLLVLILAFTGITAEPVLLWIMVLGRLSYDLWLHPYIVQLLVKKTLQ